ncbi:glycosyltransferase family 4 protein (plasmid) [Pedobacter sp. BS3]|nr:glycosyltransferase family 4 protein [Pedobacter sp. BS3]
MEERLSIKVFYTWGTSVLQNKYDPDFGRHITWDIPLLDGYEYHFTRNIARQPGSSGFLRIQNPDLAGEIEAWQADAILLIGYAYAGHVKVLRYFSGKIPVWFRGDSTLLDEQYNWKSLLKTVLLRWVYKHVDKALYVGEENRRYFKRYGLKDDQLVFVPHAVDNERFAADRTTEATVLRQRLGISDQDVLILFAGKLEPKKDPQLLLEAFIEVKDKAEIKVEIEINKSTSRQFNKDEAEVKPKVHLLFVGNGVLEESLKWKVESEKLKDVHFMDFQNQQYMPVVYQACDLFCLPSQGPGETWGLAVNEAMAAGKAVLVSDKAGCAHDLVRRGDNGEVFKAGDKNALISALNSLCISKSRLRIMGGRSRELIKSWSLGEQVKAILKQLP